MWCMIAEAESRDGLAVEAVRIALRRLELAGGLDDDTQRGLLQALGRLQERVGPTDRICSVCHAKLTHPVRECAECGRLFRPVRSDGCYCSRECGVRIGARQYGRRQRGLTTVQAAQLEARFRARRTS